MKAKKLFPELTFKRLWNKITGVENKVDKEVSEINKKLLYTSGKQVLSHEPFCRYCKDGNIVTVTCEFGVSF